MISWSERQATKIPNSLQRWCTTPKACTCVSLGLTFAIHGPARRGRSGKWHPRRHLAPRFQPGSAARHLQHRPLLLPFPAPPDGCPGDTDTCRSVSRYRTRMRRAGEEQAGSFSRAAASCASERQQRDVMHPPLSTPSCRHATAELRSLVDMTTSGTHRLALLSHGRAAL